MSSVPSTRSGGGGRILRFTAIVLVFALLGPAIGGFSLIAMLAAISLGINASPSDLATIAAFGMLYGAVVAYFFGLVPAVVVGLIVALWQELIGRVTWTVALAVGLAAGLAFLYFIESGGASDLLAADFPQVLAALVLTCVIPTMLCWLVARALFSGVPPPESPHEHTAPPPRHDQQARR